MNICAFTHEHPGTRRCTIHPRTLTTTPSKNTKKHRISVHIDQSRNCLYLLSRVSGCALLNLCWSTREWVVAARRRWTWRTLDSDVSSGKSAGSIAKDRGWPRSSVRQRVAAIKRGDTSPRFVGGSPRRLTPELLDEIREFIDEEHGRISVKIVSNAVERPSVVCACVRW